MINPVSPAVNKNGIAKMNKHIKSSNRVTKAINPKMQTAKIGNKNKSHFDLYNSFEEKKWVLIQ